ncbi:MAG: leucyl aminopeptidase [Phenylobacterium sp.]|uniref:leucyl aminopeptidase family protein n=1 Tax=Phenylobacterium sp. TaxID=1871053 RepID=UPI001A3F8D2B|nr:leucyl aminopeptidase [Phenylobacterium sp.]MBL8771590.1 leucyl aminopeptidase [Phenylobacterium sp.]
MRLLSAVLVLALGATAADARPIEFSTDAPARAGALVLPLASAADLEARGRSLDPAVRAAVARALASARFDYKAGASLSLRGLSAHDEIVVLGVQPERPGALTAVDLRRLGGAAAGATAKAEGRVALLTEGLGDPAEVAVGAALGSYRFADYKAAPRPQRPEPLVVVAPTAAGAREAFQARGAAVAEAVAFTRDLVTEPANILYPEVFVERTRAAFRGVANTTVEALDAPAMQKLGMNAILSVGQGSPRPPRMLVVEYKAPGAKGPPIVFTGKGITFDSGGVSIKPGSGMWRMKTDMAGAAAAVGGVLSLAKSGAPVHVVAIAALAENMPDGAAARPGDVVRAMNGKSIERLNTDAEGRIVLADATAYAQSRFKPAAIVNLATLTGAVGQALGDEYAGLFTRHEGLASQIEAAARQSGEPVWRLPLHPSYAKDTESPIADIRDIAEGTGSAGAGVGAHVIAFFADPETPWAHLDIASVAWIDRDSPTAPRGAQGWGVQLLDTFARAFDAGAAASRGD